MSAAGASREPIAYVTRHPASADRWVTRLSAAMPDESVKPFAQLTPAERAGVRVAVVADPDPADLAALPALEWVQSTWAGVERMLAELPPNLPIARMVDPRLAEVMAEAVLTATLWLHRDGPAYARQQRERVWAERDYVRPQARTVGVLGIGALGGEAARRLAANGFRTLGWRRDAPRDRDASIETLRGTEGLRALLARSDIVVCLLPLTDATRGLLDADAFAALRPGAAIVNFGRGAILDETALLAALDGGRVGHALLDVFATEPLPADHPFWAHPSVTVWPHVSAPTDAETASLIVARNVGTWRASGVLPQVVDRARGY